MTIGSGVYNLTIAGKEYRLVSYEADLVNRCIHVRLAPLVDGLPDVHGAVEHETICNEPEPARPDELAPKPEFPQAEAPDEEHAKYAAAMQDWLDLRRRQAADVARYEAAVRQAKGWDEWFADPRPEHEKALDFFRKRRGL